MRFGQRRSAVGSRVFADPVVARAACCSVQACRRCRIINLRYLSVNVAFYFRFRPCMLIDSPVTEK